MELITIARNLYLSVFFELKKLFKVNYMLINQKQKNINKSYLKQDFDFQINPFVPILLFIISALIPIINQSFNFYGIVSYFILFFFSYLLGLHTVIYFQKLYNIKLDNLQNSSLYFGLVFSFPILSLTSILDERIILVLLLLTSIILTKNLFKNSILNFKFNVKSQVGILMATVITIIMFANFREMISITPIAYTTYFQDFYFFTAITNSIKDFDFSNANYDSAAKIYYHVLGFFPSALISGLTKLPSHTSLWSMSMPIAIFTSYSSIITLLEFLKLRISNIIIFFVLIIFVFHFPINPKTFLNGQLYNAVWFGSGHTLPVLPTWAGVYIISIPLYIAVIKAQRFSISNIIVLAVLGFMLAWAKITAVVVLYPLLFLFLLFYERRIFTVRQISLILSSLSILLLSILYYSKGSGKFIFSPGQIIKDNLGSSSFSISNLIYAYSIGIMMVVIWIGFKWLLIYKEIKKYRPIIFSFALIIFFCLLLQSIFRIYDFNEDGKITRDLSSDLQQFMRTTFIFLDLFGVILFVKVLKNRYLFNSKMMSSLVLIIPISTTLFNVVIMFSNPKLYLPNNLDSKNAWNKDVIKELNDFKETRKAMISSYKYSGQFIAAHDINNFYVSIENANGGYTLGNQNSKKYTRLKKFINGQYNLNVLKDLKTERVKLLIATPENLEKFHELSRKGYVSPINGNKWLFRPNLNENWRN